MVRSFTFRSTTPPTKMGADGWIRMYDEPVLEKAGITYGIMRIVFANVYYREFEGIKLYTVYADTEHHDERGWHWADNNVFEEGHEEFVISHDDLETVLEAAYMREWAVWT